MAVIGGRGPVEINPRDTMARDAMILGVTLGKARLPAEMAGIHAVIRRRRSEERNVAP